MIRVIRQDGVEMLLNTDLIEVIEEAEEKTSLIRLTTGDVIHAKTPAWDISQKAKAYIRGIMQENKDYDRNKDKSPKDKEKEKEKEKAAEKSRDKEKQDRPRDKDRGKPRDRDKGRSRDRDRDSRDHRDHRDRDKKGRDYGRGQRR